MMQWMMALAAALMLGATAAAAEDAATASLRTEVARLQTCTNTEWASCAIDFMEPAIAENLGGMAKVKEAARMIASSPDYKDLLASYKTTKFAVASPVTQIGHVHYARVASRTPFSSKGRAGAIVGIALAVSRDGGKTWRFADTGVGKKDLIEPTYPGAWEKLSLADAGFIADP